MKYVKFICIVCILLENVLFPQVMMAKESSQPAKSYDINDTGSYYDSDTNLTYVFVKGIISSYSENTDSFILTSAEGEDIKISTDGCSDLKGYVNSEVHVWYSRNSNDQNQLIACSPETFWENINEIEYNEYLNESRDNTGNTSSGGLENKFEHIIEIEGEVTKYISFWLTEDKQGVDLVFVKTKDGSTKIFSLDSVCDDCKMNNFHRTFVGYVKLYEGMEIEAIVFENINVAYYLEEI